MIRALMLIQIIFLFISACTPLPPGRKEFNDGYAFHKQKKFDEAIASYKKALEKNGNYEKAAYNLGAIYFENRDYDNAEKYLKRTVQINSDHNNANYLLAAIYLKRSDHQNAYRHIILTKGKEQADFFRSLVKILIKNGYYFDGKIAVSADQEFEPLPGSEFKWTKWQESRVDYEMFVKNTGEKELKRFTLRGGSEAISGYAGKVLEKLKYEKTAMRNSSDFAFKINGRVYIDPVGTEIELDQSTFEEIMDRNMLDITDPGMHICWFVEMLSNISVGGEVKIELTIQSDGKVSSSEVLDRYKAPKSVADCISKNLKSVKFNEFNDKKERKLVIVSSF